ncbi:General stress protein 69 [Crateriforma conspicua]|uniref:General stress protein 69 n=2 Tax=Crateriforma conspicua TaxID=2527996 RepID=A0A5C6FQJ0_9PLAN|nr:General stress protein 69 [Crateriforma conspicua]
MRRRSFLGSVSTTVGIGSIQSAAGRADDLAGMNQKPSADVPPTHRGEPVNGMPRRKLGRTPIHVSIATYPGLALMRTDAAGARRSLHDSFERGVNYFDVAPAYGKDGECEIKMGQGLQGLNRNDYVLSCKTKARDKAGMQAELQRSLDRLKTDYFDLYQLHCLIKPQEVVEALGPGGAMEGILEAQKQGKIRHIGFSAHTTKSALRALRHFDFDTVMFPINFAEYYTIGFGKQIVELANQRGTAILGMKTLGYGRWPKGVDKTRQWWYRTVESDEHVRMALQFTLGFPGVVTTVPPSWPDLWDKVIEQSKRIDTADGNLHDAKLLRRMKNLAQGCESIFHRFEQSIAQNRPEPGVFYADSPHEKPPCMRA